MFERLIDAYMDDRAQQRANTHCFIENGYFPTWNEENRVFSDRGLKEYSTETRWKQYNDGKISREKAVEFARKRYDKQLEKEIEKRLSHLRAVSIAPDVQFINVYVNYVKSAYWGYNPHVEVVTNCGTYVGYASGCGYDKESAAVADAFNKDLSILKALYTLKEKGLEDGLSDYSATACTGHDNRNICGYGSGYSVIPYFEGGVGVNCFWSILNKCGFETFTRYSKHRNIYFITKKED